MVPVEEDILPHVLWAGFTRRLGRVLWRTLSEMDLAVKICTTVLLAAVVMILFHNEWGALRRGDGASSS